MVRAVRLVAERSGIVVREVTTRREGPDPRDAIWEVNAAAEDWFKRTLREAPAGAPGRDYLAQREVGPDIAERFGISLQTVKHHLTSIFDKTGVSSRLELALFAIRNGLVGRE